MNILISERC